MNAKICDEIVTTSKTVGMGCQGSSEARERSELFFSLPWGKKSLFIAARIRG